MAKSDNFDLPEMWGNLPGKSIQQRRKPDRHLSCSMNQILGYGIFHLLVPKIYFHLQDRNGWDNQAKNVHLFVINILFCNTKFWCLYILVKLDFRPISQWRYYGF